MRISSSSLIACRLSLGPAFLCVLLFSVLARGQQTTSGPSLEETIAYINSHASRTRGTTAVSVQLDANLLVIQTNIPNYCGSGCDGTFYDSIPFRVVSQVHAYATNDNDGTGDVRLSCKNGCMHEHLLMPRDHNKDQRDQQKDTGVAIAAFVDDADQGERITHALTRLITLLNERYQQQIQQRDPNDPFK
jgi:hypothetical protein